MSYLVDVWRSGFHDDASEQEKEGSMEEPKCLPVAEDILGGRINFPGLTVYYGGI